MQKRRQLTAFFYEGQYSYTYHLSSDDLGEGKYYIRMFRDGKMEDEILVKVE